MRLQFPNTDVREVLEFYGRLTGKKVVTDNQVQGTVYIAVPGEVPPEEAVRIIEINLQLNGFTLVPAEGSDIVKVVGTGKNPRNAAVPILSDELLLPQGEQVVTFIAKLRYADPTELQQVLTTYAGQSAGGYTNFTALPKAQTLLITESASEIRGLLHLIHEIDIPPAEVVSEFIQLNRADAADILEKLKAIFEKQPTSGQTATANPPPGAQAIARPAVAQGAVAEANGGSVEIRAGALSEDSIIVGKIRLTADVRSNRIHVVTRPVNMPFVRKLIQEFDSIVTFGEPVERPLRFIPVSDVIEVVVKAITEPGMKEEGGATGAGGAAGQNANRPASQPTANTGGGGLGSGGSSTGGGSGGGSLNVSEGLATTPVNTEPEARIIGTTKIIADKNANKLIIFAGEDVKAKIFRLLDALDQRIPQVMLYTTIGELDLDDKHQFGVDYILRNAGLGVSPIVLNSAAGNTATTNGTGITNSGTTIPTSVSSSTTGTPVTSTGTSGTGSTGSTGSTFTGSSYNPSSLVGFSGNQPVPNLTNLLDRNIPGAVAAIGGSGLTGFVTAGNSMTAIVTALENSTRFRVISRPNVIARNNKKAIIASGQEIAIPAQIQSALNSVNSSNGLVTNSSVEYKEVTLQLEMVPLINSDREVSLDVLQKIDNVSGSTVIDNNSIPTINTRYVRTSVTVPNDSTLVLGGLIQQSTNKVKTGIPVLSSIPLLGTLFSNTTKEKIRQELVILVRPVVSWTPPEGQMLRQRAEEFLNLEPNLEASLYPPGKTRAAHAVPFRTGIPTPTPAPAGGNR